MGDPIVLANQGLHERLLKQERPQAPPKNLGGGEYAVVTSSQVLQLLTGAQGRKDSQRKLQVTCFSLSETPSEAGAFIPADELMATEEEHTWIALSS